MSGSNRCHTAPLTISIQIALAPTGRILFFSRHPAMLGVRQLAIVVQLLLIAWI